MKQFFISARVYYSDTDMTGAAKQYAYINWAEHGRTESLRSLFPDDKYTDLYEKKHILVAVKKIDVEFKKDAFLDDIITVRTVCSEMGHVSALFKQDIMRNDDILATLSVTLCFVNPMTGRPTAIPDDIREAYT